MGSENSQLAIMGMTLSLDVKDLSYGSGQSRFFNIKAEVPEGSEGIPPHCIDKVVDQSLDMHLAMWESVTTAKYAAGELIGKDALELITRARSRVKKMREVLTKLSNDDKVME